jgi:phosphoribosylglycinamide formyltransferase-1
LFCFRSSTNAENIIQYFAAGVEQWLPFYKQPTAGNWTSKTIKVRTDIFSKEELLKAKYYKIKINWPDLIVLAGFYWNLQNIIVSYPNKIIIYTQHYCPSMEERECMEWMFAVAVNKERNRHNIHYVNEDYDKGGVVFQKKSNLNWNETRRHRWKDPWIRARVLPKVIAGLLNRYSKFHF